MIGKCTCVSKSLIDILTYACVQSTTMSHAYIKSFPYIPNFQGIRIKQYSFALLRNLLSSKCSVKKICTRKILNPEKCSLARYYSFFYGEQLIWNEFRSSSCGFPIRYAMTCNEKLTRNIILLDWNATMMVNSVPCKVFILYLRSELRSDGNNCLILFTFEAISSIVERIIIFFHTVVRCRYKLLS